MTCRHTVSLGAYLLGALDPADRSAFSRHLDTCPICKAEMLRLAPLPGLLQRLTPEDYAEIEIGDAPDWPPPPLPADLLPAIPLADIPADIPIDLAFPLPPIPPPAETITGPASPEGADPLPNLPADPAGELPSQPVSEQSPDSSAQMPAELVAELPGGQEPVGDVPVVEVLSPVTDISPKAARRGWWRRQGLAVAAAAAVVLLAIGGLVMFRPVGGNTDTAISPVTWTAVDPTTGVHGRVELTSRGWGTEVKVSMQDVPAGRKICHLVVYGRDGTQEVAGKWTAGYYREVRSIPGSSSIRLKDIDRVEVIAAGGVLVGMHSP
ncbi:hypothetical protein JOF56_004099 [Kibdelosporangium banguiense]|uniref:Putative zinc-finger domain-containing protein n=1 Tax=Kibdelosporangium banguiense TaxID=1365924 RepID=A0ABS4THD6_9PSEU|nr:zf-HC2 domain-containing protein [Kibdelosporangium banguiense]MBP2323714.1 hypothetical protein [Kibdelosporangium banguiense]